MQYKINVCFLCEVSNITEVQGSSYSMFGTNDVVYLLKSKPVKPEVSMNFDSHSGNTIPGTGTEGTTTNVVEDDFVSGIKGTGLYLHDGGKVALTGSNTECWTNIQNCTSGMTVSIWFKLRSEPEWNAHIMASAANIQEGFTCYLQGKKPSMAGYVTAGRYYAVGHTPVVVDEWSLITGTFHYDHGITIGVNGVFESANTAHNGFADVMNEFDWRGHIGVEDRPPYTQYHVNGVVDEFKLFYRLLNNVGMYLILVI